jgi:signal peptidase I
MEWLCWAVLSAVILAAAFVITVAQYGWEFDAVLSGSMVPKLGVGGLVVIKPMEGKYAAVGDIISFKLPGIDTPICHRIIDRQETAAGPVFHTKGDANEEPDIKPVPADAVTGKEVFYLPYMGNLARLSHLGRERVNIMGRSLPIAVLLILPMGLAVIGLTFKDTLEETFRPVEKRRKDVLKKRRERFTKRRRSFS